MQRRRFVAGVVASGTALALAESGLAQTDAGTAIPMTEGSEIAESGYAPVNGMQLYYELHGEGEPLVLVHGAFGAIDLWGPILETLAADHQVIAVELQGHGHTGDIDRAFSYEAFASDLAALMDHLGVAEADVVGYSLGGTTALRLAMDHPERVRRLVAISGWYRMDGYYPEVLAGIQELTPEAFAGSPIEDAYQRNAPSPDDFPKLIERMKALDSTDFSWPEEVVQKIAAPVLLVYGDADVIQPEHMVTLFRLLGGGVPGDLTGLPASQLAVIPGTTHLSIVVDRMHLWLPMAMEFLAVPMPQ